MIVNNEREALCVAMEMERRAIRIYERALLLAADDTVRGGIEDILQQEREHLSRFTEMRESYPAAPEEEIALLQAMGAEALFPGGMMEMERADGLTTLDGLYAFAAQSEQHAMETYLTFSERCRDGKVAAAFQAIAAEESAHLISFQQALTPAALVDMGICPTCYDREHDHCLYGDNRDKMLFENDLFECFLAGNPRAEGHTVISSKAHYKDMMDIPDAMCREVFVFAKKAMNAVKSVYGAESVYLCTMCDGPMNHFHVQLIPRYGFEKRGSGNFVKERKPYQENAEKLSALRRKLGSEEE